MRLATLGLFVAVFGALVAPSRANFSLTGGEVRAYAQVGVDNYQDTFAPIKPPSGNPANNQLQSSTKADVETMNVTALANMSSTLLHGKITLNFSGDTGSVTPSEGRGSITIGFTVPNGPQFYLDTFILTAPWVGLADLKIDGTTFADDATAPANTWVNGTPVALAAGAHSLVARVNLLVDNVALAGLLGDTVQVLEFNLHCVPEPSQYAMLGLVGIVTAAGRYGVRRFWPFTA